MVWSILEFVKDFNKKEKKVGNKASSFFTLKTSEEINKEQKEKKQYQDYLQNTDIDYVIEASLEMQRNIIARANQCKSLIKKEFLDRYLCSQHRDLQIISNFPHHFSFRIGYLSVTGYSIAIEIGCYYFDKYYINFASLHNTFGNMKQEIGTLPFNEIISIPYPEWFVNAISQNP